MLRKVCVGLLLLFECLLHECLKKPYRLFPGDLPVIFRVPLLSKNDIMEGTDGRSENRR
jgi:hypothetical protein